MGASMRKRVYLTPWSIYGLTIFLWVYTCFAHVHSIDGGGRVYREYGLIENATALMLLGAVFLFLVCLKKAETPWEKGWLLILAVGAIYFLGEEISWGYHFFHYDIDADLVALNDQQEPNLHNLTGTFEILFDKLPRQLLSIGIVIGGVLGCVADRKPSWPKNASVCRLIPSGNTLFIAVVANIVSVPEKIADHVFSETPQWLMLGNDSGELKECLIAFFILLYAYGLYRHFSSVRISR